MSNQNWISLHVFYNHDPRPLLIEAAGALVKEFREQGLIDRWFFIRYWENGPHVRIRFLVTEGADSGRLVARAEEVLYAYLKKRPSLFDHTAAYMSPASKKIFEFEYGFEALQLKYPDGEIPYHRNNSVVQIPYVREYDRYGGVEGLALAERHFEISSDLVLEQITAKNVHVRSILLGQCVQMMLRIAWIFLENEERMMAFLDRYIGIWQRACGGSQEDLIERCDKIYGRLSERLDGRFEALDSPHALQELGGRWAAAVREHRREASELLGAGRLTFPDNVKDGLEYLLTSFVHMTNNRMGVMLHEEVYLAYLVKRAVENRRRDLVVGNISAAA